jgi:hypothetical protein
LTICPVGARHAHGKPTVASTRTLLSDHVNTPYQDETGRKSNKEPDISFELDQGHRKFVTALLISITNIHGIDLNDIFRCAAVVFFNFIAGLETFAADSATVVNDLAIRTKNDFVKKTRRS